MKLPKFNQKGIAHILAPVLFIAIFAAIGGYVLLKSQAASVPDSTSSEQSNASDTASGGGVRRGTLLKAHPSEQELAPASSSQHQQALAPASSARNNPDCYQADAYDAGGCYYYVYARQKHITATGVSAYFSQAKPILAKNEYHTLIQMAIWKDDYQQIEFGWTVDSEGVGYKDLQPRLFVDWTINGYYKFGCPKKCGFVSNPKASMHMRDVVRAGVMGKYGVKFVNNQWRVFYNDELIGYLPEKLWKSQGATFNKIHGVDLYGEVSVPYNDYKPHSQMGNGLYGTSYGSASINRYSLIGSNDEPSLRRDVDSFPRAYSHGSFTPTSMNLGGPGI